MIRKRTLSVSISLAFGALSLGAQPAVEWVQHYNGPANMDDAARQIALGPGGTVTVVGQSDSDARRLSDIVTVRYDANGNELWVARYNGALDGIDIPTGVDVDDTGAAYVTGRTYNGSNWDYLVIKYRADGAEAWIYQYNGPGDLDDWSSAIVVDGVGNAYVSGYAFVTPGPFSSFKVHFHVAKYDTNGNLVWQILHDLPAHWGARARDVRFAPDGNLVVTGQIDARPAGSFSPQDDIITMKITPDGQILWSRMWDSGGDFNYDDDAWAVRPDRSGNVYVLGTQRSDVFSQNFNATLLKYAPDGTFEWVAALNFDREEVFEDLIDDAAGNVYLAGGWDNAIDVDAIIASYTPAGQQRWLHVFNEADTDYQNALAVMLGPDGLLYFGLDWEYNDAPSWDPTVLVVDRDGTILDQWRFDSGQNTPDVFFADAIAVGSWKMDAQGNIFLGAYTDFFGVGATRLDFTTIRVSTGSGGIPGDVDGDGDVDLTDLAIVLADFGCTGGTCPGDADGDGDTDLSDLAIVLGNFGS